MQPSSVCSCPLHVLAVSSQLHARDMHSGNGYCPGLRPQQYISIRVVIRRFRTIRRQSANDSAPICIVRCYFVSIRCQSAESAVSLCQSAVRLHLSRPNPQRSSRYRTFCTAIRSNPCHSHCNPQQSLPFALQSAAVRAISRLLQCTAWWPVLWGKLKDRP